MIRVKKLKPEINKNFCILGDSPPRTPLSEALYITTAIGYAPGHLTEGLQTGPDEPPATHCFHRVVNEASDPVNTSVADTQKKRQKKHSELLHR
jgi:hypothetical protein